MQTEKRYEILLAAVIAARATSFIFSKMLLQGMATLNLLALRFLLAFALLSLVFLRKLLRMSLRIFASGLLMGILYFFVMLCELTALRGADSSVVSLLENCSVILVPLLNALVGRHLPSRMSALCAAIALCGVVLLGVHVGNLNAFVLLALLAAVLYAVAIVTTGLLTRKETTPGSSLCMGIVQLGTIGYLSLVASLCKGGIVLPATPAAWGMLLVLVVICTGFGFTLQPVAQAHVSIDRSGLFCALNPAIATLLGVTVLHEQLGALSIAGVCMILLSIMLPYLKPRRKSTG